MRLHVVPCPSRTSTSKQPSACARVTTTGHHVPEVACASTPVRSSPPPAAAWCMNDARGGRRAGAASACDTSTCRGPPGTSPDILRRRASRALSWYKGRQGLLWVGRPDGTMGNSRRSKRARSLPPAFLAVCFFFFLGRNKFLWAACLCPPPVIALNERRSQRFCFPP
jgi:hypothetical protein